MIPVDFKERNKVFVKPEGWKDEECGDCYAYVHEDDERPFIITAWQPSKEDIEAINSGRPVFLQLCQGILPPHSLFTVNESGERN